MTLAARARLGEGTESLRLATLPSQALTLAVNELEADATVTGTGSGTAGRTMQTADSPALAAERASLRAKAKAARRAVARANAKEKARVIAAAVEQASADMLEYILHGGVWFHDSDLQHCFAYVPAVVPRGAGMT